MELLKNTIKIGLQKPLKILHVTDSHIASQMSSIMSVSISCRSVHSHPTKKGICKSISHTQRSAGR